MWRCILVLAILLAARSAADAGIRAPSCEALVAFALGARLDPIEISFGKPAVSMSVEEFDQAIDVVQVCVDQIETRPADVPGLTPRERKRPQLTALLQFIEDLKFYRSGQRERERRAAQKPD